MDGEAQRTADETGNHSEQQDQRALLDEEIVLDREIYPIRQIR